MPTDSKIRKLILLLGSSHDGEVVAAARALVRHLVAGGRDLHDLAAAVTASPSFIPDAHDWRSLALACLARQSKLRSRDRSFLQCILKQSSIPPPQTAWLDDIADRAGLLS